MLIALLQPGSESYHLFDDIMLLSEGELTVQAGFCVSLGFDHAGWA